MRIGVIYSRLRVEEKWLFAALDERNVAYDRLMDREVTFDLTTADDWQRYDAVIIRSLSTSRGLYAAQVLNSIGVPTINSHAVAAICSDKVSTTTALTRAGLPQPRTRSRLSGRSSLQDRPLHIDVSGAPPSGWSPGGGGVIITRGGPPAGPGNGETRL